MTHAAHAMEFSSKRATRLIQLSHPVSSNRERGGRGSDRQPRQKGQCNVPSRPNPDTCAEGGSSVVSHQLRGQRLTVVTESCRVHAQHTRHFSSFLSLFVSGFQCAGTDKVKMPMSALRPCPFPFLSPEFS